MIVRHKIFKFLTKKGKHQCVLFVAKSLCIVKVKNSVAKKQEEEIVSLNKSLLQLTEEKNDIEVENAKIVAESKARVEAYSEKLQELQQTRKQLQDITTN